nr:hypothetical protein [Tanacetum cinerariifolium]
DDLVPISSESEGIPEHMCDVPFHDNSPPLDVSKDQFEDFSESNDEVSSTDKDSFSIDNIDYVEASPPDSELVSSEVMGIVIPEVGGIDDDILLTIKDDNLCDKLLNVNLLIATIEALNDNPTPSSDCKTKSSSTSLNSLLEETRTFHNSLPEFKNFYFYLREISSGSTTTHCDISLPDYEAFYFDDDHVKEISSGSTTTYSDISLSEYDSFIFDLTHEEFVDELAHIISPPQYDYFYFRDLPDPGELMFVLNFGIRENLSATSVNLPIKDDHSPLLAYVPQFPLKYESEQGYNENYTSYPYDSSSLPQQYPCCTRCGGPHMNFQCQPMNQDSYSLGFDQPQPSQCSVIHQPPQELSIQEMEDLKQQYLDELKRLSNLEYRDEIKIAELTDNFNSMSIEIRKKEKLLQQELTRIESMGDEHFDTIPATGSDEVIKSSVENLVPIPSESEGIPEHKCDVPFHDNSPPLDVSKDQIEDFSESNNEVSSIDNDSLSIDNIDYVEASPPDSELVSSEVMEIVIPEVGGIDDDIPLTIKDDNLREKLLNVNLLIATIEALNNNPTPSSDCKTKSSSTSPKSFLEETNTFHNSLPEFENFYFDLGEISSGSITTHSDISLPDYEVFSC